jgi:hypothetical protein
MSQSRINPEWIEQKQKEDERLRFAADVVPRGTMSGRQRACRHDGALRCSSKIETLQTPGT